jgi:hypothetical protein
VKNGFQNLLSNSTRTATSRVAADALALDDISMDEADALRAILAEAFATSVGAVLKCVLFYYKVFLLPKVESS